MFDLLHNSIFICGIVFLPQSIINLNKPPKQVLEWVKIFSQEIHGLRFFLKKYMGGCIHKSVIET